MSFREVPVFEVREVLRLWLGGRSVRAIAGLVPPDRKTVTKVIAVAVELGLTRQCGVERLDDEFVGVVMAGLRRRVIVTVSRGRSSRVCTTGSRGG